MELVYPKEKLRFIIAIIFSVLFWAGLIFALKLTALYLLLGYLLVYLFAQSAFISHLRGTAVRVGPLQMQELNQQLLAACRRLKLEHPPELYLLHSEGVFNALAARFLGRDYVVLYSSVVEALEPLPGALAFYIGHELGHLRRGHYFWKSLLLPAEFLPLLGPALARAWEYTCDRHGLAACENPAYAKVALAAMAAGRGQWKKVNLNTYQEQVKQTGGFWMAYHEITGDYPWLVKRMTALSALTEGGEPVFPMRNPLAFVLAFFTPRAPAAGGGVTNVFMTVALIGVLAAVAIPAYQDYLGRAAVDSALRDTRALRQSVEKLTALQLRLPTVSELDVDAFELKQGEVAIKVESQDDGRILVSFDGGSFKGEELLLYPKIINGDIRVLDWYCTGDLQPKLRPKNGCIWSDEPPADTAAPAPSAAPGLTQSSGELPASQQTQMQKPMSGGDLVAMAQFNRLVLATAKNGASGIAAQVEEFHKSHHVWPKSLEEAGVNGSRMALDNQGSVIADFSLAKAGEIDALIHGGSFDGNTLSLKPRNKGYDYSWICSGNGIAADYLPEGCR